MSNLVILLRTLSLLAVAGSMLLVGFHRRREQPRTRAPVPGTPRGPLAANLVAFGLFFPSLVISAGGSQSFVALLLALVGCSLALSGTAVLLGSRAELGPAWSLVPRADESTGLVTSGPYRLVRHPMYLGFVMLAVGQSLAFGSWSAFVIVLIGIVPTLIWRAVSEERLLSGTFGEGYELYRQRTRMIIPHIL